MNIPSINSLRQYPIVRKILPKKHVEIPMELSDKAYNKISEHRRALDYLTNRYGITYAFAPNNEDSAYIFCSKKVGPVFAWSKEEIKSDESFSDSAKKIYKLTDEVLDIAEG